VTEQPLARPLYRAPPWAVHAACRGLEDVMFGDDIEAARAVCGRCQVRPRCLGYALDAEPTDGVWAGTTFEERLRLCPVCQRPKPPSSLACGVAHVVLRIARLKVLEREDPDVDVSRSDTMPTARTNPACTVPRGSSHASARAYKGGCRCVEARIALAEERTERRLRKAAEA